MPRTYPPRRTLTAIRLSPVDLTAIDALAAAEGVNRSAMMRTLIGEALAARERKTRKDSVVRDDVGPAQGVPWIVAEVGCLEVRRDTERDGTLTVHGIYPDEATARSNAEPAYQYKPLPKGDPRRFEQVPQPWQSRSEHHGEGRLGWVSDGGEYEVHVLPLMPDPADPDTPTPP